MEEVKPYLLSFDAKSSETQHSIFPSYEVRRQYVDAAFSLFNQGLQREAKAAFSFLLEVISNDPNVFLGQGACLLQEGKQDQAKIYFEKAEQLMPSSLQSTILKLRSYVELGMTPAAQAGLNSAIDDAIRQSDEERKLLLEMVGRQLRLQTVH